MKINNLFTYLLLLCILLFSFIMRTYRIAEIPTGFFADEASIGYNAYTIATTGKDEHGIQYPIFFKSFGDFKHPLQIYVTVPFVLLLGLNEFSTRLPSVLFGIITIIFLYLIGKEIVSAKFGLVAASIAATMPWLFHYNRIAFDCNAYVAFFTASVFFLLRILQNKNYIIPFFLLSGITFYTYQPAKLIVPFFTLLTIVLFYRQFIYYKKQFIIGLSFFILLSIPLFLSFITGEGFARFSQISLFSQDLPQKELLQRIVMNSNNQFNPKFLFFTGELTFITRHFINGLVPIFSLFLPFWIIGIITIIRNRKQKAYQALLLWLVVYPLGAAFITETHFTNRSIIGAPLFILCITFGIYKFFITVHNYNKIAAKTLAALLSCATLISTIFFSSFILLNTLFILLIIGVGNMAHKKS